MLIKAWGLIKLTGSFAHFRENQKGATAIEYGFLAVLISLAGIAAFTAVGGSLNNVFSSLNSDVANATPGADGGDANAAADVTPTN